MIGEFSASPLVEAIPVSTPFIGPEQLMRESGRDQLLRLGANESTFGPSPRAIAAMSAELPRLAWYGDPESYELREALAAKHGVPAESICVGSGIDELMGLAVRAFLSPGDCTLAIRGTYPTFTYHVVGYGGKPQTIEYKADGSVDIDALIARARELAPKIVYLANPDNPSGTLVPASEVERLFESLPDCLLLLDEAYADFLDECALLPQRLNGRLIRLRTFSKAYGLAGARIGYAISSTRTIETLGKIRLQYGVNRNAQIGALASLDDLPFVRSVVDQVALGRKEYYALAQSLGLGHIESCTNFVCVDFSTPARATQIVGELLARGVFVRKPGAAPLDRFVRVSVGTRAERERFGVCLRALLEEVPV
ncbi:MAG: aminotransferase class I/II-fold pyridoxal phosphate-dependent enzyme [Candidatus Eremiobacteraeota bacterium]|nr:aminotransferase class I/II-fold pyridoxal phosphate-dependent enzyme [Candidatus Eremiobacteraeota bacterium]